jgi:hypothetical protein
MASTPDDLSVEDSDEVAYRVERLGSTDMTSWSRRPERAVETAEQAATLTGTDHQVRQVDAAAIHEDEPGGEVVYETDR